MGVGLGVGFAGAASDATWVWVAMAVDARGAAVTDGAVGGGGADVDDEEQPATRMMTVSRAATEREVMPIIVPGHLPGRVDSGTGRVVVARLPVRRWAGSACYARGAGHRNMPRSARTGWPRDTGSLELALPEAGLGAQRTDGLAPADRRPDELAACPVHFRGEDRRWEVLDLGDGARRSSRRADGGCDSVPTALLSASEGDDTEGGEDRRGALMVRRILAGVILLGLGLALFGSQVSADPGRIVFGSALLLLWGATGLAVLTGLSWGRLIGLALSVVGFGVAIWEAGQANTGADDARLLVDVFFVARDPHFAWINVAAASFAFAALSAIAGALLVLPFAHAPKAAKPIAASHQTSSRG